MRDNGTWRQRRAWWREGAWCPSKSVFSELGELPGEMVEPQHFEVPAGVLSFSGGINAVRPQYAQIERLIRQQLAKSIQVVRLLLEKGAKISDDLLQSVQLKVNIREENAELGMVRPDAVEAWRGFLKFLVKARQRQQ